MSRKFLFPTDITSEYVAGSCGMFALVMNNLYGNDIMAMMTGTDGNLTDESKLHHYVNRYTHNRFIDIEGVWTFDDLTKRWLKLSQAWGMNSIVLVETDPDHIVAESCEISSYPRGDNMLRLFDKHNGDLQNITFEVGKMVSNKLFWLNQYYDDIVFKAPTSPEPIYCKTSVLSNQHYFMDANVIQRTVFVLGSSAYHGINQDNSNIINTIRILENIGIYPHIISENKTQEGVYFITLDLSLNQHVSMFRQQSIYVEYGIDMLKSAMKDQNIIAPSHIYNEIGLYYFKLAVSTLSSMFDSGVYPEGLELNQLVYDRRHNKFVVMIEIVDQSLKEYKPKDMEIYMFKLVYNDISEDVTLK